MGKAPEDISNDKTPVTDVFWPDIKHLLFDASSLSFGLVVLSQDQRKGILNLITKANKDLRLKMAAN